MQIIPINYTNPNIYIKNQPPKRADKNMKAGTNFNTIPACYANLLQKNNFNFRGHELKEISRSEFRSLKKQVIEQASKNGINLNRFNYRFKNNWWLQYTNYLLNHKVIENIIPLKDINDIIWELWRNSFKDDKYDVSLAKSNCESVMDFADFIVQHPIYDHPAIKMNMTSILMHITKDNVEQKKILADYLSNNPDKLEDTNEVRYDLVSDAGYKYHKLHGDLEFAKISEKDLLPTNSVVCTLHDITDYILEHLTEVKYGQIFNKPVTKDGESLLIALAHVKLDDKNINSYIKLVENMQKMPLIDYNQKDSTNVPFIAHVLMSQNKALFAAVTNCKNLKYDPSLEFEFNSITDPEFKELVLKTPIFENEQNAEYETIFGKPNPMYGQQQIK